MKKKLEAELISIAHRVLKIHNREGIAQLQQEALNLYQKLSILRFYEEHFEPAKPTIGKAELEAAIEDIKTIVPEVFDQESEAITDITIESTEVLANIAETSTEIIVEDAVEEAIEIVSSETPHPLSEIKTIEEKKEIESDFITETTKTTESFTNKLVEAAEETKLETTEIEDSITESSLTLEAPEKVEIFNETENTVTTDNFEDELVENSEEILEVKTVAFEPNVNELTNTESEVVAQNPLFKEEQPTLVEQFKAAQTEQPLFTENLFSEIDDDFTPKATNNSIQTSFENLFGQNYQNLEFVKAEETVEETIEKQKVKRENKKAKQTTETNDEGLFGAKQVAELYTNAITLGINDRIAFQIHLFNNSDQDLNRVVSQLNTMNNLDEALDFINNMVKPDYNNWQHKDEYEDRFMALVEKRFS